MHLSANAHSVLSVTHLDFLEASSDSLLQVLQQNPSTCQALLLLLMVWKSLALLLHSHMHAYMIYGEYMDPLECVYVYIVKFWNGLCLNCYPKLCVVSLRFLHPFKQSCQSTLIPTLDILPLYAVLAVLDTPPLVQADSARTLGLPRTVLGLCSDFSE